MTDLPFIQNEVCKKISPSSLFCAVFYSAVEAEGKQMAEQNWDMYVENIEKTSN